MTLYDCEKKCFITLTYIFNVIVFYLTETYVSTYVLSMKTYSPRNKEPLDRVYVSKCNIAIYWIFLEHLTFDWTNQESISTLI